MTLADRDRLAAILGMLGSEHQGERAAAALHAEAFRRKHQLTWAELLAQPPIEVAPVPPAAEPEPPPQPPANDYPGWSQSAAEHAKRFHEAGQAAYPDWKQLCVDLIQMGADAQFATLLITRPDGIRLVAALANDPKTVRAIAALKTEAARARALAEFAVSSLHQAPPPPPQPAPSASVSRGQGFVATLLIILCVITPPFGWMLLGCIRWRQHKQYYYPWRYPPSQFVFQAPSWWSPSLREEFLSPLYFPGFIVWAVACTTILFVLHCLLD